MCFLCFALAAAADAAGKLEDFNGRPVVPGRVLVQFARQQGKLPGQRLAMRGFRLRRTFRVTSFELWKLPPGMTVARAIRLARSIPGVVGIEPDYLRTVSREPNDSIYYNQYATLNLSLPQAWDLTTGSASVVIALIDSG
ncbi:MAG TPA: hypothetical protein VM223_20030, partial [Planctomycetota bacterium]|nr:hypothetical protein [Planctomycetota bacterium]